MKRITKKHSEFAPAEGATNVALPNNKRKTAFTLAEVLITLAVIGVVAALTIPTLIQSYNKQVASTKLKKFYSSMEQALKLSQIDNGPISGWVKDDSHASDYESGDPDRIENANKLNRESVKRFFETYLKPYIRTESVDYNHQNGQSEGNMQIRINLSDGSVLYMHNGYCTDFRIDINGDKKPNEYGKDLFSFLLCTIDSANKYYGLSDNQSLKPLVERPYVTDNNTISREKLIENCKNNNISCSALLMYDNWEFKDDYPYKF